MKNKLPRKYRIISRVHHSDAPENVVSLRYVGMHNGFADDSRKVRRSDAPENIVSPRDAGMYNGDAGDTKMAETLALSGFAGGGGSYLSPVRLSHTQCAFIHGTPLKKSGYYPIAFTVRPCPPLEGGPKSTISRWGLIPSTFALVNPLKTTDHRYVIPQRFRCEPRRVVALRDLKQKTTQVKTCEKDYKGTKSTLTNRFIVK